MEKPIKRHESREKAMICLYQYLLCPRDMEEIMESNFEEAKEDLDPYIVSILETSLSNKDRYIGYINEVLNGWTFDRLGYIEQAILLNGCSEFDLKQTQAAVIMDESIRMAKKYCDPDTYKLINGVLDTL